jgi:2-dehydro-3-deoxyphosphooctonate aldolase (KDO 8-P synthase)
MQTFEIQSGVRVGPDAPLLVIAGPCLAESRDICLRIGAAMKSLCAELGFGYVFKASFDKANRSSIKSYRGAGMDEGLKLIADVGKQLGAPTTTDIHESEQASTAAQAVDILQIPAFLCRQTDLLLAAAATGKTVNVKKGQFVSPAEMQNAVDKLVDGFKMENHTPRIMLTERGTFFGYHRLVTDFVGLGDLMELNWPVCFDVTHSTQKPGESSTSGGRPERAPLLARCAAAAGVQALFLEVHPDPRNAKSDAATMLTIEVATRTLREVAAIRNALQSQS